MMLKDVHHRIETVEQQQAAASLQASNLPSRKFVEKSVRYESSQERRKEKAIKMLLLLQARRKEGRS